MGPLITIVMYHYVRDLQRTRFPDIKGLDIRLFKEQINYIQKYYNVIGADEFLDIINTDIKQLPPKALLLTFDDAYIDHFTYVFPVLNKNNLSGVFFPSAKCILNHQVLDVNKIHFILASVSDKKTLISDIYEKIEENRIAFDLETNEYYWGKFAQKSRWDTEEVVFIKRILQHGLPERLRNNIAGELFHKYVTIDETAFSEELYMSKDQISHLEQNGMKIGSHGYDHYWLDKLDEDGQKNEIEKSIRFLEDVGVDINRWIMCYPNGAYNETLLKILSESGCTLGLTTQVGIADLTQDDILTLPRLNTNDLPKDSSEPANEWTLKVLGQGAK